MTRWDRPPYLCISSGVVAEVRVRGRKAKMMAFPITRYYGVICFQGKPWKEMVIWQPLWRRERLVNEGAARHIAMAVASDLGLFYRADVEGGERILINPSGSLVLFAHRDTYPSYPTAAVNLTDVGYDVGVIDFQEEPLGRIVDAVTKGLL